MNKYTLEGHNPVACPDLMKWAQWFESANRRVDRTEIGDVVVSTIFLGLDHSFDGGPPELFETLIFGGSLDGEMQRYSTWDKAEKGHEQGVAKVKKEKGKK